MSIQISQFWSNKIQKTGNEIFFHYFQQRIVKSRGEPRSLYLINPYLDYLNGILIIIIIMIIMYLLSNDDDLAFIIQQISSLVSRYLLVYVFMYVHGDVFSQVRQYERENIYIYIYIYIYIERERERESDNNTSVQLHIRLI